MIYTGPSGPGCDITVIWNVTELSTQLFLSRDAGLPDRSESVTQENSQFREVSFLFVFYEKDFKKLIFNLTVFLREIG